MVKISKYKKRSKERTARLSSRGVELDSMVTKLRADNEESPIPQTDAWGNHGDSYINSRNNHIVRMYLRGIPIASIAKRFFKTHDLYGCESEDAKRYEQITAKIIEDYLKREGVRVNDELERDIEYEDDKTEQTKTAYRQSFKGCIRAS